MFINPAFADTGAVVTGTSGTGMVLQLVLILLVFYLFLIRPQQKKLKQHEQLLQSIKKGDKIVTGGGIIAKVTNASDPFELTAEIAPGVEVRLYRATVRDLVIEDKAPQKPANTNQKPSKKSKK